MPLTAEDVSNKRFTTVRLREGYDMTEVDQFLDEVEAELRRLNGENDELQAKLRAAGLEPPAEAPSTSGTTTGATSSADGAQVPGEGDAAGETPGDHAAQDAPVVATATAPSVAPAVGQSRVETLKVTTTAEASAAATRLLELAGRSADQLVAEAEQKAGEIVGEAKGNAEELESGARSRAEALETETEERRRTLVADVEQEKVRLDAEIEKLRAFEREYRAELRTYFEEQLATLDGHGAGGFLGRSADRGDAAAAVPSTPGGDQPADPPSGDGDHQSRW